MTRRARHHVKSYQVSIALMTSRSGWLAQKTWALRNTSPVGFKRDFENTSVDQPDLVWRLKLVHSIPSPWVPGQLSSELKPTLMGLWTRLSQSFELVKLRKIYNLLASCLSPQRQHHSPYSRTFRRQANIALHFSIHPLPSLFHSYPNYSQ